MGKIYTYYHDITIGDTDMYQSMFFTHYFQLQATIRELWAKECVSNFQTLFKEGIYLVTRNADCDYFKGFSLYDKIKITFQVCEIKRVSVTLLFKFYNDQTGEIYAEGTQQIVFTNANRQVVKIPDSVLKACLEYRSDEPKERNTSKKRALSAV